MDRTLTLYHGSSLILKHPQFGKGTPFHDYASASTARRLWK